MFHTQAFWLRTLRLNPLKPFGSRCCVVQALGFRVLPFIATTTKSTTTTTTAGRMQAEKHRSALPTGPLQASGRTACKVGGAPGCCRSLSLGEDKEGKATSSAASNRNPLPWPSL